jgi:hypothetical protein
VVILALYVFRAVFVVDHPGRGHRGRVIVDNIVCVVHGGWNQVGRVLPHKGVLGGERLRLNWLHFNHVDHYGLLVLLGRTVGLLLRLLTGALLPLVVLQVLQLLVHLRGVDLHLSFLGRRWWLIVFNLRGSILCRLHNVDCHMLFFLLIFWQSFPVIQMSALVCRGCRQLIDIILEVLL